MYRLFLLLGWLCLWTWPVHAKPVIEQVINLKAGWNLLSYQVDETFSVDEFKAALSSPERLKSVWDYVESEQLEGPGVWKTGQPLLQNFVSDDFTMQPGRAYWVDVSQDVVLTLSGTAWDAPQEFHPGWNLVGFAGAATGQYERQELESVFSTHFPKVQQVWTFDPTSNTYPGYDTTAIPQLKELSDIRPGQGYWVYATEGFVLSSSPYIALEGDLDASPLQQEVLFNPANAPGVPPERYEGTLIRFTGDEDKEYDLNNNGIIDTPFTQDTLHFDEGVTTKVISIGNTGQNAVNWKLETDASWLSFDVSEGVVSSDTDKIVLTVDRAGKLPGRDSDHTMTAYIGDEEHVIKLILDISTASGDWKGIATAETVNGKDIPIGAVDLAINLFMNNEDLNEKRFRAVLNSDEALLFPRDVFMNGFFLSDNKFTLTTNFLMSAGDRNTPPYDTFAHDPKPHDPKAQAKGDKDYDGDGELDNANPFPYAVTREITLIGERLSPNRMEGTFTENLGGMLPDDQVITVEGTFFLDRSTLEPTKRSIFNETERELTAIGGSTSRDHQIERTIHVANPVAIEGVTFGADINYEKAQDLTLTLIAPDGKTVILHDKAARLPEGLISMDDFNSTSGAGDWKLRISWDPTSGERGYLNNWSLNIEGIATYNVSGKIVDSTTGSPLDRALIILTGSNLIEQFITTDNGEFIFQGLTENKYSLSIQRPGYNNYKKDVFVPGQSDLGDLPLNPPVNAVADLLAFPKEGFGPLHVNLQLLIPSDDLTGLGDNLITSWEFGDGNVEISSDANPEINPLYVSHTFDTPGHYTVTARIDGDSASPQITQTVDVHVQRVAHDPTGEDVQLLDVIFAGSLAAPLSDAGDIIQLSGKQTLNNVKYSYKDISGTKRDQTLSVVQSATVYQQNKRDTASFDIDREPTGSFLPSQEDTDFFTQEDTPYHNVNPTNQDGIFTPNTEPNRYRAIVRMGGFVFSTHPSAAGGLQVQTGRSQ